LLVDNTDRIIT